MPTLYLNEQGTRLGKKDERLIILRGQELINDIPVIKVDRVIVMGQGVQVSHAAIVFLAQRGIPLIFTTQSGGSQKAMVSAGLGNNAALRLAQCRIVDNPNLAVPLVQAIVVGKVANQIQLLERYGSDWGGMGIRAKQTMQHVIQQTQRMPDIDQLRGLEGAGAAAYWGAWSAVFKTAWGFAGRAYRPTPDPLNALLSFGYTLLLNDLMTAVQSLSFDPYLGIFHTVQFGRPSLALDLEEEFRPCIVDRMVLDVLDAGLLQISDFSRTEKGFLLNDRARKSFIQAYEQRMQTPIRYQATGNNEPLRRVLLLQTQHLARVLQGEEPRYQPYYWSD